MNQDSLNSPLTKFMTNKITNQVCILHENVYSLNDVPHQQQEPAKGKTLGSCVPRRSFRSW